MPHSDGATSVEEIRASKYRRAVELSRDGIWMVDNQWCTTLANAALCQLLGYRESEMLGKPVLDFYFPEDREVAQERLMEREAGIPQHHVVRYRGKDGGEVWVEITAQAILDAGKFAGAIAAVVDLTEKRKAEAALRASEERFQLLARATNDAIWDWDLVSDRLWRSEGMKSLVGLSSTEFGGKVDDWISRIHPEDRERTVASLHEALTSGKEVWAGNYRFRREDGAYGHFTDRGFIVRDASGNATRVLGGMTDVTERLRAEGELKASRELLQTVAAALDLGFWSVDLPTGRVTWTEEHARLFGIEPDKFAGTLDAFFEHVHPEDRESVRSAFNSAAETCEPYCEEFRIGSAERGWKWIGSRGRVYRDDQGRPARALGMVSDITARKRLEEEYLQAQKMESIGRLAGGIAHDFNNLLTAAIGYAELALYCLDPGHTARRHISEVLSAATKAADLTRQLLTFARKQTTQRKVVDINEEIGEMKGILSRLIGENIVLVLDLGRHHVKARLDPIQFEQVLMNLAVNARDAMPNGGTLSITTRVIEVKDDSFELPLGKYVRLAVRDNGCGMNAQTVARAFEPFFTTKGVGKGTGLGLATCHGIVAQSGGRIILRSRPRRGTTVEIYLPYTDDEISAEATVPESLCRATEETILLAEDEPAVRELVVAVLEERGYQVLVAANGADALRLAADHDGEIDLVVTDAVMPGMNGRDLIESLKAVRPTVRALLMSGYDSPESRRQSSEPELAFLQKPFTPERLSQAVRDCIEAH